MFSVSLCVLRGQKMFSVPLRGGTLPHDYVAEFGAARIEGAGGTVTLIGDTADEAEADTEAAAEE